MKIGAVLAITDPERRGDPYLATIASVIEQVEKMVIVNGGDSNGYVFAKEFPEAYRSGKLIEIMYHWPKDSFSWAELPKHLNMGVQYLQDMDWILRLDADYVMEDNWLVEVAKHWTTSKPTMTIRKISAIFWNTLYEKANIPIMFKPEYEGKKVIFGKPKNAYSDLCFPILHDGEIDEQGVPIGMSLKNHFNKTNARVFNYDYTFRTKSFTKKEFYRFSQAHKEYFGYTQWGDTEEEAFDFFISMMSGRIRERAIKDVKIDAHPKPIHKYLKELTPGQFGFNGWGLLYD